LMLRHLRARKKLPHSPFVVFTEARARNFPEPLGQKGRFLAAVVLELFGRSQESSRIRGSLGVCPEWHVIKRVFWSLWRIVKWI
jgi:hypothetical protein